MDALKKPGAFKAKSNELVLEKFFYEYIVVWYREGNIPAMVYERARKEIDLLKIKKEKSQKGAAGMTEADVSEVRNLSNDLPKMVGGSKRPKSENKRQAYAKVDSPKHFALSSSAAGQQRNGNKDELQRVQLENCELKKKLSEMREKLDRTRTDAHIELKEKEEQIEKLNKYLENSKAHIDDFSKRLSKLTGEKLRQGNPDLADLSDPNRPTEIGKQFSEVYDNEWSDAFENIPKMEEEKKIGVLHGIVTGAFLFCQQKIDEQNRTVETIILAKSNEAKRQTSSPRNEQLVQSLDDLRMQLSTETAKNVAQDFTTNLLQVIVSGAGIKQREIQQDLKTYASKCAEICWLLLAYNPKVSLSEDLEDEPFDQDTYLPYTRRLSDLQQPTVDFCVWPALCRDCDVLVKGVAQPKGAKFRKPLDLQR